MRPIIVRFVASLLKFDERPRQGDKLGLQGMAVKPGKKRFRYAVRSELPRNPLHGTVGEGARQTIAECGPAIARNHEPSRFVDQLVKESVVSG